MTSPPPTSHPSLGIPNIPEGSLRPAERFWVEHQPWLQERGYTLRPRYMPDWKPSWEGTNKRFYNCEDSLRLPYPAILDATRASDGALVSLKKISKVINPYEVEIAQSLSSESLANDPHNHCVPVYEVLDVPGDEETSIIVMPLLRLFNLPPFETVGETIDFCQQMFEGLSFIHCQRVAHRDISILNIMMDPKPMFPDLYHPASLYMSRDLRHLVRPYTRTERPTKYYFVDFGISRRYGQDVREPQELPLLGGYKTVPEFQGDGYDRPANPFHTDVFYLGYLIQDNFLQPYEGLEFMSELVKEMTQADPKARPTIDTALKQFESIRKKLSWWKLRTRLVRKNESTLERRFKDIAHVFRTTAYVILCLPPVPKYRP